MWAHALDHLGGVGLVERGLAGQQVVQHHAAGQQVTRRGGTLGTQQARVERHRALVRARAGRLGRDLGRIAGRGKRHQADSAALVDQHAVELWVEVGDTGFVGEGQALQQVAEPAHDLARLGVAVGRGPLAERDAVAAVDGNKRPVILHADLGDRSDVRVVEPGRETRVAEPVFEPGRIDWLHPRQGQHHLVIGARVEGQPHHRRAALRQQLAQLEATECPGGIRRRSGQGVGDHLEGSEVAPLERKAAARNAAISRGNTGLFRTLAGACAGAGVQSISTTAPAPVRKALRTIAPGCAANTAAR